MKAKEIRYFSAFNSNNLIIAFVDVPSSLSFCFKKRAKRMRCRDFSGQRTVYSIGAIRFSQFNIITHMHCKKVRFLQFQKLFFTLLRGSDSRMADYMRSNESCLANSFLYLRKRAFFFAVLVTLLSMKGKGGLLSPSHFRSVTTISSLYIYIYQRRRIFGRLFCPRRDPFPRFRMPGRTSAVTRCLKRFAAGILPERIRQYRPDSLINATFLSWLP